MEIDSYIRDNIKIVEADPGSHVALCASDIRVDRDCRDLAINNKEIILAIRKRFKNKRTLYDDSGFVDIVI